MSARHYPSRNHRTRNHWTRRLVRLCLGGTTQRQVADEIGMDARNLSRWLADAIDLSPQSLERIEGWLAKRERQAVDRCPAE